MQYPFRPGYSALGVVTSIGRRAQAYHVGDRVVVQAPHAAHVVVDERKATMVPRDVGDADAAWFAIANVAQIAVRRAGVLKGHTVAVLGAGIVGQMVAQFARVAGAREIVVIAPSPFRLRLAAYRGATRTIAASAAEALGPLSEITDGRGVDVVFDVTGNPAVFADALRMARQFGTVVAVGDPGYPERQHLTTEVMKNGLHIVGSGLLSHYSPAEHGSMAARYFSLLQQGYIGAGDLVTHRFSPLEAPAVYAQLTSAGDDFVGVVFDWTRL